jgi:hypothetical protein
MSEETSEIWKEIEKIKQALIDFSPLQFKIAFCKHEPEKIEFIEDFYGKTTGGIVKLKTPFFRCKKCMLITDEVGNPDKSCQIYDCENKGVIKET